MTLLISFDKFEKADFVIENFFIGIVEYAKSINALELSGLIFGLLCVYFLIKQNILTWICGIIYVLISFVIFWQARLYGDFILHIFFLVLNIYGWYAWINGQGDQGELQVSYMTKKSSIITMLISIVGIILFAQFLIHLPNILLDIEAASLPYWDSTTSILSVTGMWLTTKKKIENWYYWLLVDVLATGIYFYKDLYFYSLLYFIYIGLAVAGYIAWRRSFADRQKSL